MTVSVVIPQLNRADLLARALRSLHAQRLPPGVDLEVIVADNGSVDASVEVAGEHGARTILLGTNRGVSHALNRGIDLSRGEWVVLLNNDVDLAPDWLAILLDAASRADAWFATGKVFGRAQSHLLDGAGDAACRGGVAWRLGNGKPDVLAFSEPRDTFFPSATASLFRRAFFERAGLFDESFFAYLEDVELGMRAAGLGLRGIYVPDAVAWHLGSETGGQWSDRTVAWITRHQLLILAKHYSEAMLLRFGLAVVVAQLLWAALALSRGRFKAWLRGFRLGWRDCRERWRAAPRTGDRQLAAALLASEGEIARFQKAGGWDSFWKWYFRLAGRDRGGIA